MLRCQNPGSTMVAARHRSADFLDVDLDVNLDVCAEHRAKIDAGANWDLCGEHVVMGRDIAPALERWTLLPSRGTDGFTLVLETAGRAAPIELFLTTTDSISLALFLYPSSGLPLPTDFLETFLKEEEEDSDW